ncbi:MULTISPECIES: ABC transporter ATP-binding protein [Hyphomonas]|uniref:ABC transporter ATP-binding protein n=2 Tax=Hyphomonas adhaerens TaxID=81029 RepID=A0A069E9F3_9PROT|nr:ATP-binding cassette domain-containing protein [Hyphomonas adhaerens]KCZ85781.1 ABC transporter ATP-binding protein [Hyphomonas adhaerens MHS-3]MBB40220.1 ABC transporter ATP-binding protein [Hyphomonas sp.]HAE26738.1 ABC transporter ATP-binding protein [Hyphomonas adhaerens]
MTTPILSLQNVEKRFGKNHVLRGVTLDVAPGQSLVVIGGSGSGKSVMLKSALGLMTPDSGQILFNGEDVTQAKGKTRARMRERVGMLFQSGALFDSLTVWENVAFRLVNSGVVSRAKAKDRAIETLSKVRLGADVADLYPAEISGGMQKRVSLARSIISKPDLIFFDEPTTGLDPITADAINDLIIEQVRGLGAATVSITHDMASARKIADEVAMLFEGKIIWRGKASEVEDSGNAYVDQFVHGRAEGPIQPAL